MDLLAHIAAPTSKKGDEQYKAQFLAYLEFEPVTVSISPEPDIESNIHQALQATAELEEQDATTLVEASVLWKSPFQQLEEIRIHHTNVSWPAEKPNKVRRQTPEFSAEIESFQSISTVDIPEDEAVSRILATQPVQTLQTPSPAEPSSLLPDTYSLSKSSSTSIPDSIAKKDDVVPSDPFVGASQDRCQADARNALDSLNPHTQRHTLNVGSQVVMIHHGLLLNPGERRAELSDVWSNDSSGVQVLPSLPVVGRDGREKGADLDTKTLPNSAAIRSQPTSSQLHELSLLPTEIWPPPPEANSLDWHTNKSHVTQDLLNLEPIINPAKRYKPLSQSRALVAWERGYWHIDTDSWSVGTQLNVWKMLEKTIKRGAAGYATWCEMTGRRGYHGSLIGLGKIKLWCWGDEVMHMYLLLYTASLRKVAKVGAQWRSWNGDVIVQMKDDRDRN